MPLPLSAPTPADMNSSASEVVVVVPELNGPVQLLSEDEQLAVLSAVAGGHSLITAPCPQLAVPPVTAIVKLGVQPP